jgi:Transposase IS4
VYQLPQNLSIDEQLIKFKGRSKHTIQMNSKAAGEGYKIYSLCCSNGYLVDFKSSSAVEKIAELEHYEGFTPSESIVLDLANTLTERFPRPRPFYVLHLDNFFTTRRLYQELYERGIGANGTAKARSGIPKELAYLRDAMTKEKDHGEWFNYVVGSVNCIVFCDSASKAMMTTVHDPTVEEYAYFGCYQTAWRFSEILNTNTCYADYRIYKVDTGRRSYKSKSYQYRPKSTAAKAVCSSYV